MDSTNEAKPLKAVLNGRKYMAALKIDPIDVTTTGGLSARIDGIDPTNSDCLHGEILPSNPHSRVRWDLLGRARDNHDRCNLDMDSDEMRELAELAKRLGAPEA
ncbi:hypothetical protein PP1Y_Spl19 (plasmid) [Novosphingobium sp. PP1Y]|nr:hypothetical protein PP1Y_Spl19 [Novosphingobium sp. PP1Y]